MLHNAGSLASRFRRHGGIDSFVRAVMSMDNLAAALVCSMISNFNRWEPHPLASITLPDSVVIGD